jgi:hypothetical protein
MAPRMTVPCPVCQSNSTELVAYRGFMAEGLSVDLLFQCLREHHRFCISYTQTEIGMCVEYDVAAPVPDMRHAMGLAARRILAERASSSSTESA